MEQENQRGSSARTEWKPLIVCLAIPVVVGAISGIVTRGGMKAFESLRQPALSPPGWLFPVVWTLLFLLMGLSSYLVLISGVSKPWMATAFLLYGLQLAVNFVWTLLYFNAGAFLTAFFWLVLLWLLIGGMTLLFFKIDRKAGALLIPYWAWVSFAGYLNYGVYLLNQKAA